MRTIKAAGLLGLALVFLLPSAAAMVYGAILQPSTPECYQAAIDEEEVLDCVEGFAAEIPTALDGGSEACLFHAIYNGGSCADGRESGGLLECGYQEGPGDPDDCAYTDLGNSRVRYPYIVYNTVSTTGKVVSSFADSGSRSTVFFVTYVHGDPQGKDYDHRCREWVNPTMKADVWGGYMSGNSQCGISNWQDAQGGWNSGIRFK